MNVLATVIGQPFLDFVKAQIAERNERLAFDDNRNIAIDPEILRIVRSSTAVSTQHGNSVQLLKVGSKRRRTRAELDELERQKQLRVLE